MAEILSERELERFVGSWKLTPSRGGVFEFTVSGDLLYSKKQSGRHAEPGEIRALLEKKVAEARVQAGIPIQPE